MKLLIKKIFAITIIICIVLNILMPIMHAYNEEEPLQTDETEKLEEEEDKETQEETVEQENEEQPQETTQQESVELPQGTIEKDNDTDKEEYNENEEDIKIEQTENQEIENEIINVTYSTHVQNIGWQSWKSNGETAGTSGKSLRLEAIKIQTNSTVKTNIKYQVHIQDIGWQSWKSNGEIAGTSGRNLRLEAIKIRLESSNDYTIRYRVHIQNIGWQDWKTGGEIAGTSGQSLRLEAIEIVMEKKTPKTKLYIDTQQNKTINSPRHLYVQGWKMTNLYGTKVVAYLDGNTAPLNENLIKYQRRDDVLANIKGFGTAEENPLPGFIIDIFTENLTEGAHNVIIKAVLNNKTLAEETINFEVIKKLSVEYSAHIQNIGWNDYVDNGETCGNINSGKRIEALKLNIYNSNYAGTIQYSAHVQNIGWQNYVNNNEIIGTTGKGYRIEAIKIRITEELLENYDIYYRTYAQNIGWLAWTLNGEISGTQGMSCMLEAIEIKLVEKGTVIDTTGNAFIQKPTINYKTHVQDIGWQKDVSEGNITGTTGQGKRLEAIQFRITNTDLSGTIKCSTHVQDKGWLGYVDAGAIAGTTGQGKRLEAIKIKLTGELEQKFDIYYRTHVQNLGWIAWAKNGEPAGSEGYSYRLEAIQIKLVAKGGNAPGNTGGHFYNKLLERKSIEGVKLILGNVCAGIDVSSHQGNIDWRSIKNQADFAIIRCGYGQNYTSQDDMYFETNIQGCINNGIPIEVYLYSYADSVEKASSEADHILRLCNKYKNYINKIWYDVEDASVFNQINAGTLSKESLAQIVDTFSNKLKTNGYNVGLYSYTYALNNYFTKETTNKYDIWAANYPGDSQDIFEAKYNLYKILYKMWQFTSEGTISGISGNVDMSIRF